MSKWHGYFRRSAGPGWALCGDAGHFKDPTLGQGISDALRQVDRLAGAVESGLGGGLGLDRALRDWWSWRDRDAYEMYWLSQQVGAAGETPLIVQEIQQRIAGDRQLQDDLFRVLNHDLAPSKLFSTGLALSAAARTFAVGRGHRRLIVRQAADLVATAVANKSRSRAPASLRRSNQLELPAA